MSATTPKITEADAIPGIHDDDTFHIKMVKVEVKR